ncbi:MAG: DUF2779 domain-containing protein, partial [Bacteroidetes bacterium]|nr:DUF2779 domain-containing protein [Bacteroidota bacterium]
RALKRELEGDDGVIFRYAAHENTYLCKIDTQLRSDPADIPDRAQLCAFIRSITRATGGSTEPWHGERSMTDMLELVKRHFYHPFCNGSNSIKYVLPAVLNESTYLREKYAHPVYGAEEGIRSLNFRDWQWIHTVDGKVVDPYLLLPRLFEDIPEHDARLMTENPELRDGGAAMTAYARMQFEEMSDYERAALRSALLKYCELDTLAMVMICEYWLSEC